MGPSAFNRLRRWHTKLEMLLGFRIEVDFWIIFFAVMIIGLQLIIIAVISAKDIYCDVPTKRSWYLSRAIQDQEALPTIYLITPTYSRHVQKAELIRLSHTFMLIPNLHWIIVEDSDRQTGVVSRFVRRLKNQYDFRDITLLHEPTPDDFKLKPFDPRWKYPKGVWQRNRALKWLRDNLVHLDRKGVVYFADDDNTYDLELFNDIRYTELVSVWPVGFAGGLYVERPILKKGINRIQGFNSVWRKERPFPIDMAGFAVSLRLLMSNPNVSFSAQEKIGYIESHFLGQLVKSWDELEPKARKCTTVFVWHTQTKNPILDGEDRLIKPSYSDIDW